MGNGVGRYNLWQKFSLLARVGIAAGLACVIGHRRVGTRCLPFVIELTTKDADGLGRLDGDAHRVALYAGEDDLYIVSDHNGFPYFS